jgi:hypothetical protein
VNRHNHLCHLLCISLTTLCAAAPTPRQSVEAAYKRAALAAKLKFVEGLLSNRADEYRLFTRDGRQVDLTRERQRFNDLFAPALRVRLDTTILSFDVSQPDRAICGVRQLLRVENLNHETQQRDTTAITTLATDTWIKTSEGWRILATQAHSQATGAGEPLPVEFLRTDPRLQHAKPKGTRKTSTVERRGQAQP